MDSRIVTRFLKVGYDDIARRLPAVSHCWVQRTCPKMAATVGVTARHAPPHFLAVVHSLSPTCPTTSLRDAADLFFYRLRTYHSLSLRVQCDLVVRCTLTYRSEHMASSADTCRSDVSTELPLHMSNSVSVGL